MKIYLHEITDRETELHFTQNDEWVSASVLRVDEKLENFELRPAHRGTRLIDVDFSLRKVDEVYVVSGNINTSVELVCSRCANSYQHPCQPHFSALFCKDPIMSGIAHLYHAKADAPEVRRLGGQNRGFARHAHHPESTDISLESKDVDITYLSQDFIDLSEVITEQLQLQIPFQPLCKTNCKGICAQCGADLNVGRCACAKLAPKNPFSVLRDFKL